MFTLDWSTHFAGRQILLRNWIWFSETTGLKRRRKQTRRKLPPSYRRISFLVAAFFMTQWHPDQNNSPLSISAVSKQPSSVLKLGTIRAWGNSQTGWTWLYMTDSIKKWRKSRGRKLRREVHSPIFGWKNSHTLSKRKMCMSYSPSMEPLQVWKWRSHRPTWGFRASTPCLAPHMSISQMKSMLKQLWMPLMESKFWRVPTIWGLNFTKGPTSSLVDSWVSAEMNLFRTRILECFLSKAYIKT